MRAFIRGLPYAVATGVITGVITGLSVKGVLLAFGVR
jgi:hypothetical protein